jgi:hypothetical protein
VYPARPKGKPSAFLSSCEQQCAEHDIATLHEALHAAYAGVMQQGQGQVGVQGGLEKGVRNEQIRGEGCGAGGKEEEKAVSSQKRKGDTERVKGMSGGKAGKKQKLRKA